MARVVVAAEIGTTIEPGDVGRVAALHGRVYADYGLGPGFEAFVAKCLAAIAMGEQPGTIWLARAEDSQLLGSIALESHPGRGRIRVLVVAPEARGSGLGNALLEAALGETRARGFATVDLWTFDRLDVAAHLYRKHGFSVVEEQTAHRWGVELREQRYELVL